MSASPFRRALVTGIGVLSPIGNGRDAFGDAVIEGSSGIDRITAFPTEPFRTGYGGEVRGFDPTAELTAEELARFEDAYLHLALAAARRALADAGLVWSREQRPSARAALVVGTCNGGLRSAQRQYEVIEGLVPGELTRQVVLLTRYHTAGKALSFALGVTGPTWVVTTACSSSTAALGLAQELIAHDLADVVLAGGADALCLATMAGFDALKATSTDRTAPFSTPIGLNLGEGAAFWVVEEGQRAAARNAAVEGEILAHAFTADAHHPTAPDPRGDGAVRTMNGALERAGASPAEIGCFNLHGTGTEANDRTESRAVARVCGRDPVPVHSFKSQVGHCLGAAGLLEASAGLLAMRAGKIPATINFDEPRPGCNLDYVPNEPRDAAYDRFLSCNYAFGGHNAGVVIGQHDPERGPAAGPDGTARTVLTGSGVVSSFGLGAGELLAALREGRRGPSAIAGRVSKPTAATLAGYVPPFESRDVDRRIDLRPMNPISRFATAAARLSLADAGIRVGPRDGLKTGVINGVYVGPSEEQHMRAVTRSGGAESDIAGFSTVVANSTGGWVSNALLLKGYSCTISQGADAGFHALMFAHLALASGSAPRILAGAADELYSQYVVNYDELGLLCTGDEERDYRLRLDIPDRRVLAEGAAYVVAEERAHASERGATPLAELVGYGQTMDVDGFLSPCLDPAGLQTSIDAALGGAGWEPESVGLVIWSPQGNRTDRKTLDALRASLGDRAAHVPLVTSVFHTGLAEACSGTATLAAVLAAWADGAGLWPQITGIDDIDDRPLPDGPTRTLLISSSELGFNLALALEPPR